MYLFVDPKEVEGTLATKLSTAILDTSDPCVYLSNQISTA